MREGFGWQFVGLEWPISAATIAMLLQAAVWPATAMTVLATVAGQPLQRWPAQWQVWLWRGALLASLALTLQQALWPNVLPPAFRLALAVVPATNGPAKAAAGSALPALGSLLLGVYLLLLAGQTARLVVGMVRLHRQAREVLVEENLAQKNLANKGQLAMPFVYGLPLWRLRTLQWIARWGEHFAARIVMPSAFVKAATPLAYQAAMAHEGSHLRHHDFAWTLALEWLTLPLFFHPAVMYSKRQHRAALEFRCDEEAAQQFATRELYAQGLVEAAQALLSLGESARQAPHLSSNLFANLSLERRIERAMQPQIFLTKAQRWAAAAILGLVFAGAAAVTSQVRLYAQEPVYSTKEPGVTAPKLIEKVEPNYTPEAREKKVNGAVILQVIVGSAGRITEAKVLRSLDPGLDAQAIVAVKKWRFTPATKNKKPVAVSATVEVNFRI